METIIVVTIIAVAAGYTIGSLYRKASAGKKSCGCEDECPISDRCRPEDSRRVASEITEDEARWRKKLQA